MISNTTIMLLPLFYKNPSILIVEMDLEIMSKYQVYTNNQTSHESQKRIIISLILSQGWSQSYDELYFSDYYKLSAVFWQNDRIWRNFLSDKLYQNWCCNSTRAAAVNLFLSQTWNGSVSYIFQNYNWKILENHSPQSWLPDGG